MADEGEEWLLINLDEKIAKRQGMPPQLPVPKSEFEGLADKGLQTAQARRWCSDFLNNSEVGKSGAWRKKNQAMVVAMEAFIDTGPLWDKAQKAFGENDFEKAISTLKRIVIQNDADHAAKLNLASAYANTQQFDQALKLFKQIRDTYQGDCEFHVAVGHVHLRMQNKDGAIDEFVNALEVKPDHQGALDALTQLGILTKIYENPRDAASLLYVRSDAVASYLGGAWDEALAGGEAKPVEFFLEQVAYHEREQRWDVVLAAADRALKVAGDAGSERAELARIGALRSVGRPDDALAAARAYAERRPTSAGAQVELARCLAAKGEMDAANAAVDEALSLDPGDLAAIILKFWPDDPNDIAQMNDKIAPLKAFVDQHAGVAGAVRSLARAYLVVGRTDDALDLFRDAVDKKPDDDDLRSEWWAELAKQQRWPDIVKDAEKLGDMKTRDWRLRWNEAEAYAGLGKPVEARACFSAINFDESLHVDIRRRAKRAVASLAETPPPVLGPPVPGPPKPGAGG
jgi:tetratricopeptide (TPR) repeat protein